ncbi:guanylate kinase [Tundrisphaera lichenicola]|uniref:guanylate kinase n=1 Tax=Tundrisphaera lichenicola TaxID=2029860 RepID=UPI003EB8A6DC
MEPEVSPTLIDRWKDLPGKLIVLSGASGSGKSTLVERLLKREGLRLKVSVSATTRSPRPGELNEVSYYFLTRDEFELGRDRGEFLEWAEVHGHLYGTPTGPVLASLIDGICVILVIDVQGAMLVRRQVPDSVLIFVHAPSPDQLEARLRARGTDDDATIARRLENSRNEIAQANYYDYQITNDDLERAVEQLAAILTRIHCGG